MTPVKAKQPRGKARSDPAENAAEFERTPRARKTSEAMPRGGEEERAAAPRARHVDREQMIREAAYFKAERRGFVGGSPEQDWIDAEAEADRMLASQGQAAGHKA
jgi:hypothetical protein